MVAVRNPALMTVTEFQHWQPERDEQLRWQLIDGTPVCMAPAASDHARIVGRLTFLLIAHMDATMPGCGVLVAPGVIPVVNPLINHRIPDIGITCEPPSTENTISAPILLVEVLSPSNSSITRRNIAAYLTIPSVTEVLLVDSLKIEAELLRRNQDRTWPNDPLIVSQDETLHLESIGFSADLRGIYRNTSLMSSR